MERLRALIQKMTPTTGTFVIADIAEKVLISAEEQMGDELVALQRHLALQVIVAELRRLQYDQRRKERSITSRGDMEAAVNDALATGQMSPFTKSYCVDGGTWKPVADMTGADHSYVADAYARTARTAALLVEFHRQVARKVGAGRTADVFDEAQYLRLQASILGQ